LSGTPESIRRIRRDDIVGLHRKNYRPDNAILLIGGDIRPAAAFDSAKRLFAGWEKPAEAPASLATEPSVRKPRRRVVVVDMPDAGQAAVVMAHPALRRTDREYFAAIVTNSVVGGGYSARLNQEIRIKRGLSYGAGSSLEARRSIGPFFASTQTKNESAAEVAALMLEELRRLGSEPVPESELTTRKAVLIGNFGRSLETTDGLVSRIASLALYDLDLNGINTYIQDVQAIVPADVQKFASSRLSAADSSIVVVGNAKLFLESLKKHAPSVDAIPIDELDLNRPSLRRPGRSMKP
jgi:zinc protease